MQMDGVQKQSVGLSAQLQTNVLTQLTALKKEQSKAEEQLSSEVSKLNKELEKSTSNLNKAKTKYHQTAREAEQAIINFDKGGLPAKEAAKLKQKVQSLQKQTETADVSYKGLVKDHQQFQQKYEEDMKKCLAQYQVLEERRGAALKEMLEKYLAAEEAFIAGLQSSIEAFKQKVDDVDFESDMQQFLDEKQTGQSPPPPVEYEPYNSSVPLTDTARSVSPIGNGNNPSQFGTVGRANAGGSIRASDDSARPRVDTRQQDIYSPINQTQPATTQKEAQPKALPVPSAGKKEGEKRAKALFDYDAEEENELSFKENDVITVARIDESGWWEGTCGGRFGMFPGNYVELIEEKAEQAKPLPTPAASSPVKQTSKPASPQNGSSAPVNSPTGPQYKLPTVPPDAQRVEPAKKKERRCKAVFDFAGDGEDELPLAEGEMVTILSEAEGWMLGVNSEGRQGLFPANHVEEV
eukprot:TRINITY_DN7092_c0_g2_i1.p1 TRINITY_DN7092_c0_g2~~TRINITY_DN7092_c0_g2_i1.p1  ORF type:complete len:466 (+),score=170.66 TRINITY_DN7092_c0_g2_i1:344-1741(+)